MAKEMVVISLTAKDNNGNRRVSLGLYIPITTPKAEAGVLNPFASLPTEVQTAWADETAKQTALNDGSAVFGYASQVIPEGMTLAQARTQAQGMYPNVVAEENSAYDERWEFVGITIDAV